MRSNAFCISVDGLNYTVNAKLCYLYCFSIIIVNAVGHGHFELLLLLLCFQFQLPLTVCYIAQAIHCKVQEYRDMPVCTYTHTHKRAKTIPLKGITMAPPKHEMNIQNSEKKTNVSCKFFCSFYYSYQ